MHLMNRPGKSKLVLLIGCAVLSICLGTGAGIFLTRRAHASSAHHKGHKEQPKPVETVYSLGEMVVNLADSGQMRYAKLTVAVGFAEKISDDKLHEIEPMMRDAVIGVMTRKSFDQLHRKDGMPRLKKEIIGALDGRITGGTVTEVYFESFAMQ